jgi:hypothetical protein
LRNYTAIILITFHKNNQLSTFEAMQRLVIGLLFLVSCQNLFAQKRKSEVKYNEEGNRIFSFQASYTFLSPSGDLGKRFGLINQVSGGINYKSRTNWLLGFEVGYQFGSDIKEVGLLDNLTNSGGFISNNTGTMANYAISQRGLCYFAQIGKIIPVSKKNSNSGLLFNIGFGHYTHKIHISVPSNDIASLSPELIKGYDRMTGGFALQQMIGYQFYSHNRFYNFFVAAYAMQAFTESYRKYNYDLMDYDTGKRMDLAFGFKLGWMIPIYLSGGKNEEFTY